MKGLRERRIASGMTQKELAVAANTTQTVISILETDDLYPGEKLMEALNMALKTEEQEQKKKTTQTQRVYDYMVAHGSITQQEAIRDFSCYRLAAHIFDLRKDGHVIETQKVPFKNEYTRGYYAVYKLVE